MNQFPKVSVEPGIVFEDDYLLAVDKPAGMVVNEAETVTPGLTLQSWLSRKHPLEGKGESAFWRRAGIVHRLDKETSGLLLVAKKEAVFVKLQALFKERKVRKQYLVMVHGRVVPARGRIELPLGRSRFDREKFAVVLGGKEAITEYEVIAYLNPLELINGDVWRQVTEGKGGMINETETYKGVPFENSTLLLVSPATGRTHQIRVHLKQMGYPVVGDEKYGGRKRARKDRLFCPRQFLHAYRLTFLHPETAKTIQLKASLPEILLKQLGIMRRG